MAYADQQLMAGEKILVRARQHWMALLRYALMPVLVLAAVVVLFIIGLSLDGGGWFSDFFSGALGWITTVGFWVGIVWFGIMAFRWTRREYVLTDQRLMRVDGVFRKRLEANSLEMINDVNFSQTMFGRIMHYGTLEIQTASGSPTEYPMIVNATKFKSDVLLAKQAVREGTYASAPGAGATAATAPAAPAAQDITAALNNLADLRDRGALTPEEFEAKKAELLARL
jgi:uncharacterized membrane protein YdbT with pleckstrin-like domain